MRLTSRPRPPAVLLESAGLTMPDAEAARWLKATFIVAGSPLHNEHHAHLEDAHLGVLWTTLTYRKQQRYIAGLTEDPANLKGNAWSIGRQEQQLTEWFGAIPDFVLTFDAGLANELDDASWCALAEHELYHCAQALDQFDMPRFTRDGQPVYAIRGHDVEEFVGVVERYGTTAATAGVADLVRAAQRPPTVAPARIAAACGTCLQRVA